MQRRKECWLRAWQRGVAVCQRHWRLLRRYWRALDRALLHSDRTSARRGVTRDGDSVGVILLVVLGALVAWIFFFLHYVAGNVGH